MAVRVLLVLAVLRRFYGCRQAEKQDFEQLPVRGKTGVSSAAPPEAEDDRASTAEGREVLIEMVANDSGKDLEIDRVKPGNTHGHIICDADIEAGRILSCAYTPAKGYTGKDEFSYVVKDASGKTDSAMVYVSVKPAG